MKYLILFLISFKASAAAVIVDTTDIVGSIQGLGTAAIAICGAFIILSLTVFVYKKIRSLVNGSAYPSRWSADHVNDEISKRYDSYAEKTSGSFDRDNDAASDFNLSLGRTR